MHMKTLVLATSLVLSLTGASFAQTPAGGGSAEGNLNNPGSVKSNSEKAMERSTGSSTMSPADATGAVVVPGGGAGAGAGVGTAAPTGGHSSGGGTSSGGMAR